jgi:hypothetical protein
MSDDVIKQLTSIGVFHNHIELLFSFNYFIELYDIWMSHLLQNLDFPSYSFYVFLVVDFIFLKNFNGNLLI